MKRMTYFVMAMAMVLGLAQCKKEQPETPETQGVTITLNVDGASAPSTGSGANGAKVNVDPYATEQVTFENGDQILVASGGHYIGTLTRTEGVFTGSVTNPVEGEKLYFYFLGNKQGTLEADATTCTVNISDQSEKLPVISMGKSTVNYTEGETSYSSRLYNKVSLMKFNVTTPSEAAICITGMNNVVTVDFGQPTEENYGFTYGMDAEDGGLIKMHAKDANNETWAIVLPQAALAEGEEGSIYSFDNSYIGTRPAIHAIEVNKFYHEGEDVITMTVNTHVWNGDLSVLTANDPEGFATATDGMTIYGTLNANVKVWIADGATVILDNATISYTGNNNDWAGLTLTGDGTLVLTDGTANTVAGGLDDEGYSNWPGIYVPVGKTLTINGNDGVLNASRGNVASDGGSPAGIGARWGANCGDIVINGGVINATGGFKGAGIGGCGRRGCGDITINGGTVNATGGEYAAGIGLGGSTNSSYTNCGTCGNITINGGTVNAIGGENGAGIGTGLAEGKNGTTATKICGDITISGGTVTATGGAEAAGIGGGEAYFYSSITCGDILISGGTVIATGGQYAAGIGTGRAINSNNPNNCGTITVGNGASVTATAGGNATAAIGKGSSSGSCTKVTISNTITSVAMTNVGTDGKLGTFMNATAVFLESMEITSVLNFMSITDGTSANMGQICLSRSGSTLTATPSR